MHQGSQEHLLVTAASLVESYLLIRADVFHPPTSFVTFLAAVWLANVAVFEVYALLIWPFFVSPLRHVPSIKGGLATDMSLLFDTPRGTMALEWISNVPNEGLIHWRGIGNRDRLLPTKPDALRDVLSTNTYDFEKPWGARAFLARIIGFGLILSEGEQHKRQRKALTPAFHIRNIRNLCGLMWEKTTILMSAIEDDMKLHPNTSTIVATGGDGKTGFIEMSEWASRLTLDIIGPAAMGRDFQSLTTADNKVAEAFLEILEPTKEKLAFFSINFVLPQWIVLRLPWRLNKVVEDNTGLLRRICLDIIQKKKVSLAAEKVSGDSSANIDILSTMMRNGDFSDSELTDQMLTFLAAGHETTASALTWCCYLLCQNPSIQTKLRAEIHQFIATADSEVTAELLESMPYLNGVCEETLRLFPTVPGTIREAVRKTSIIGHVVPKGTLIMLVPYAINRSPDLWGPTAATMDPTRWIDTDAAGRARPNKHGGAPSNFAEITFLHGQRACIGRDFAKAELRCAVAGMLGKFAMRMEFPDETIKIAGVVTTKPVEGMKLRLETVDGW